MLYKLIAIDIDGTLLNESHELLDEVKEAIIAAKHSGVKIVLCTGRPLSGINRYLEELDLLHMGDYAITFNGAMILETATEKAIKSFGLKLQEIKEIFAFCTENKANITYFDANHMYTPHRSIPQITCQDALLLDTTLHYQPLEEITEAMDIPKIMILNDPIKIKELITVLPETLQEKYYVVNSVPYNLEFLKKGVNKGTSLQALAEFLGIKREEVMAIGDAKNDLEMLQYAGMGVVMGNAKTEIKAVANFETKSNDEAGVAYAIEQLILEMSK